MKKIKLSRGMVAMVDDEDLEYLNKFKWTAVKDGNVFYAQRVGNSNSKVKSFRMHREIMIKNNLLPNNDFLVDHRDMDGLNNQKYNLRIATHSENNKNVRSHIGATSMYLGVSFEKQTGRYKAGIRANKKNITIGRFDSEDNAAIAYNIFAERFHGTFANFNTASK